MRIPLLLIPKRPAKSLSHYFLGIASKLEGGFKGVGSELYKIDAGISATEYISYSLLNSAVYSVLSAIVTYSVLFRLGDPRALQLAVLFGMITGTVIFLFCIVYPRWLALKRVVEVDKNLLFAARHLRIQTSANVPLFEALVSASQGYGAISEEFSSIVKKVEAGTGLVEALEESASKTPSYYYSRILWQIANAVKAGTDVGPVLSSIVDFLAEEQRIEMRNYGAQLNTLAIMYLMSCIIAPTIALIFMMVISSFVDLPITDTVFWLILGGLVFVQYMFVGLIQSRRPVIAV